MNHEHYMRIALEQAREAGETGNRAVGAVIVRDGEVIGRGANQREAAIDAVGHAETIALRDAVARQHSLDLAGCILYSTLEPCPMCCGAIIVNGIEHVVISQLHGVEDRRWGDYAFHKVTGMVGQAMKIETGVLLAECAAVLREYDVRQGRRTLA